MKISLCKRILIALCAAAVILSGCGKKEPAPQAETSAKQTAAVDETKPELKAEKAEAEAEPSGEAEKPSEPEMPKPQITASQKDIEFTWNLNGRGKMTAHAKEITGNAENKTVSVKNFKGTLYQNGSATTTMSADNAYMDRNSMVLTATGNVSVTSGKTSVRAPWLKWYAKTNRIIGSGGVKIISPDMGEISAPAFEGNTKLSTYTLKERVDQ